MYTSVAESYKGLSVFITGGTGFLGKALIEKLLYSCPELDKIYLLIREKENANAQQRIQKIWEQPLFSRLRNERPQAISKIIPVVGDISEPKLGLKTGDEQTLADNVSIVFHVAATIKFNEPLEVAMNVNVAGTGRVLNLSQRMKNIKAFVYVSTAYSNTNRQVVEERIYPAPASLNDVKKLLEIGITEEQVKQLIGKRPNTYTFAKALAENLVADNHGDVPSVIIRPSIVSASKEDPIPGWIDNWNGATAIVATVGKGLTRVLNASPSNQLDLIPVDYVTNLTIVAASKCERSKDVAVYNCTTSGENPVTIGNLRKLIIDYSNKNKFYDMFMPFLFLTQSKFLITLLTLLLETIPSYLADIYLTLMGKKRRFVKIHSRMLLVRDALEFFTSNSWEIRTSKTRALAESLSPSDKRQFPCNPKDIQWNEYIPTYLRGIQKFLFK